MMINPLNPHAKIHYIESTDSTMLMARRLVDAASTGADSPLLSGTVVQAGYQTAGRGRITERKWESAPGDSLLFTVIFSKSELLCRMSGRSFTLLPLLCGLAVADTIDDYLITTMGASEKKLPEIRIKWPNDVLADGCKLCGILCEASGDWIYAGIGLNLNQNTFSDVLRRPATSVAILGGRRPEGGLLLSSVLRYLDAALGCENWRSEIDSKLYRKGEVVKMKPGLAEETASSGHVPLEGVLAGIDSSGAILLKTTEGTVHLSSGELLV